MTIDEIQTLKDEIANLRTAILYEARVAEAHYEGMKSYPKSRRPFAEEQVKRMREVARGIWPMYYSEHSRSFREYRKEVDSNNE